MLDAPKSQGAPRKVKVDAFLWPLIPLLVGVFELHRGTHSAANFGWNVFLIVIGVLGLMLAAFLRSAGNIGTPAGAAQKIAEQQRQLFGGLHDYRDASDVDFAGLDLAFYDSNTEQLRAEGFRPIRDVVNVTISNSWPKNQTVIRRFVSSDATTMGSLYHVRLFGFFRMLQWIGVISRNLKTIECETELSDGTFVTTANTAQSVKTLGCPFIDRQQFPADTSAQQIVNAHRLHLQSVLAAKTGVLPARCQNYADYQASQDRMQLLKCAYRRSPQFDHHAEWEKIAGRPLRDAELEAVEQVSADLNSGDDSIN